MLELLVLFELLLIAIAYTLFSVFLQRKLSNMKRMREIQQAMNDKTKELAQLSKANPTSAELQAKQKEIMSMASESMRLQIKPMIIILPLFVVVYDLLLPMGFAHANFSLMLASVKLTYQTFFLVVVFVLGMAISISLMAIDRKKAKVEKQQQIQAAEPQKTI
ncbi:MAG: EMC3/TMCO1 family protein [Candidatus Micrarchaeia archaeon]